MCACRLVCVCVIYRVKRGQSSRKRRWERGRDGGRIDGGGGEDDKVAFSGSRREKRRSKRRRRGRRVGARLGRQKRERRRSRGRLVSGDKSLSLGSPVNQRALCG